MTTIASISNHPVRLIVSTQASSVPHCKLTRLLFLAACALLLLLAGCGKSTAPEPERPVFVAKTETVGKSMLPTFAERETVALELCDYKDLAGGDTVVFWHSGIGAFVHHRLRYRNETGRWVTQGDNNATHDSGVMHAGEFVGRTHKLIR